MTQISKSLAIKTLISEELSENIELTSAFGWFIRKQRYSVKEVAEILSSLIAQQKYSDEQISELIGNLLKDNSHKFSTLEGAKEFMS